MGSLGDILAPVAGIAAGVATGNPMVGMAVAGGLGALTGSKSIMGTGPSVSTQTPPGAERALSVLDELSRAYSLDYFTKLQQNLLPDTVVKDLSDKIANYQNIDRFGFKALSGDLLRDTLGGFSEALQSVSNIDQIVQNQLNKTNTALALGGLINTPALQKTQADIVSSLNFEKSSKLADILSKRNQNIERLINLPYAIEGSELSGLTSQLSAIKGVKDLALENVLLPFDMRMRLASTYMGVPSNTIVQPGQPGLLQTIAPALTTWALNKWL